MSDPTRLRRRPTAILLLATFAAYLVTAKVGLLFAPDNPSATPVWPPSGIAVAGALLLGPRAALVVWPAAFIANITTGSTPFLAACGIATGNTLEALTALMLLTLVWDFDRGFSRVGDRVAWNLLAGGVATAVSATIGPLSLAATTPLDLDGVWHVARTWWLGDALGVLLVGRVLLLYVQTRDHWALAPVLLVAVAAMMTAASIVGSTSITVVLMTLTAATLVLAYSLTWTRDAGDRE